MSNRDIEFAKNINETAQQTINIKNVWNNTSDEIINLRNQRETHRKRVKNSKASIKKSRITIFSSKVFLLKSYRLLRIKNRLTVKINKSFVKSKPLILNPVVITERETSHFKPEEIIKLNGILSKLTKTSLTEEEHKYVLAVLNYTIALLKKDIDSAKGTIDDSKTNLIRNKKTKTNSSYEINNLTKKLKELEDRLEALELKMKYNVDETNRTYRKFVSYVIKSQENKVKKNTSH